MAKRKKDKPKLDVNTSPKGFSNPFAGLAGMNAPAQPEPTHAPPPKPQKKTLFANKVTVSIERKGRGGKTVTLLRGALATGDQLESLLHHLKKNLGTSGAVGEDGLVFGGDQRDRLADWLHNQGVKRVVKG